jgi:hypothetical protein
VHERVRRPRFQRIALMIGIAKLPHISFPRSGLEFKL